VQLTAVAQYSHYRMDMADAIKTEKVT
jgi:hypothetical protein